MNDEAREPFTIPLPPGFPPPGFPAGMQHDHLMFIRSAEGESPPGKEHEDIMFRRVPREIAMRYRAAAGGRGMTHAQYLTALVELHTAVRARADEGDAAAQQILDELGLKTVAV